MFFCVVFFPAPKKNVVIPTHWIDADESHIEKFMNYGVNRNQKYRCYYNENRELVDFRPKFDGFPIGNSVFPNEGCYIGKIVVFKRKYSFITIVS